MALSPVNSALTYPPFCFKLPSMLKEWRRSGEIKETLKELREAKEGDDFFKMAERLRTELSGIRKFMAKRILMALGVLALGSIAVVKAVSDGDTEDGSRKAGVGMVSTAADEPENFCELTDDDLKSRTDRFFNSESDDPVAGETSTAAEGDPEFKENVRTIMALSRDRISEWYKIILNTKAFHKNKLAGRVADFFCSGAIPMIYPIRKDVPVPDQSEFLVASAKSAEKNPKNEWLQAHGLVFADTNKRILYLDGGRENDVLAFLEVMEMMTRAGDGDEAKTNEADIISRELGIISGNLEVTQFLEMVMEGIDKFHVSTHLPHWLKELAETNLVVEKDENADRMLEIRMYKIAKLLTRLGPGDRDKVTEVLIWLRYAIESPEKYLVPGNIPENKSSKNIENIFTNKKLAVLRSKNGEAEAYRDLSANYADPKFTGFMRRVAVPVFRDLTTIVRSEVEKKLVTDLLDSAIIVLDPEDVLRRSSMDAAQDLLNQGYAGPDGLLSMDHSDFGPPLILVSLLDSPGYLADGRRKWMEEHGISYFDNRRNILFLPAGKAKYPYPYETIYTDIMMSLNRSVGCRERLEAGVKYTDGADPFLEYMDSFFRPSADGGISDAGLTFFASALNYRAMSEISSQIDSKAIIFPNVLRESEAEKMKTLAVEAHTFRIVADLRDFACSKPELHPYRAIAAKLEKMLEAPHKWFGLKDSDKGGHRLFKP